MPNYEHKEVIKTSLNEKGCFNKNIETLWNADFNANSNAKSLFGMTYPAEARIVAFYEDSWNKRDLKFSVTYYYMGLQEYKNGDYYMSPMCRELGKYKKLQDAEKRYEEMLPYAKKDAMQYLQNKEKECVEAVNDVANISAQTLRSMKKGLDITSFTSKLEQYTSIKQELFDDKKSVSEMIGTPMKELYDANVDIIREACKNLQALYDMSRQCWSSRDGALLTKEEFDMMSQLSDIMKCEEMEDEKDMELY
jgi:hypothetical protein